MDPTAEYRARMQKRSTNVAYAVRSQKTEKESEGTTTYWGGEPARGNLDDDRNTQPSRRRFEETKPEGDGRMAGDVERRRFQETKPSAEETRRPHDASRKPRFPEPGPDDGGLELERRHRETLEEDNVDHSEPRRRFQETKPANSPGDAEPRRRFTETKTSSSGVEAVDSRKRAPEEHEASWNRPDSRAGEAFLAPAPKAPRTNDKPGSSGGVHNSSHAAEGSFGRGGDSRSRREGDNVRSHLPEPPPVAMPRPIVPSKPSQREEGLDGVDWSRTVSWFTESAR